jgi:dienelactone hydrolase
MLEYFPNNYPWNLAVMLAIGSGAEMSEVDEACRPLIEASKQPGPDATDEFVASWVRLASRVEGLARVDEAKGNLFSAGRKYRRAAVYYFSAERIHRPKSAERMRCYQQMLDCFAKFVRYQGENCERVEIPYLGKVMPALYTRAIGVSGRAPCMIHFDGLDGTKELLYLNGISAELSRRGISTLIVDHPGVGEALRLQNLPSVPEIEVPADAAFNFASKLQDVDQKRIGIMAVSLGGFYAPRVAALDSRFACCVAWGALYDWGALQRSRLTGGGTQRSVPHYVEHLKWVLGKDSMEECLEVAARFNLRGILDRIRCPILIVHAQNDRQIPVVDAQRVYDECVNSPRRDLKIHTPEEGGVEHCSVDNFGITIDYMSDWIAEVLGGRIAPSGIKRS